MKILNLHCRLSIYECMYEHMCRQTFYKILRNINQLKYFISADVANYVRVNTWMQM